MSKTARILLVSVPIGTGHVRAAEAIGQAIHKLCPEAVVCHLDIFTFFPHKIGTILLKGYYWSLMHVPWVYGQVYDWGNEHKMALIGRRALNRFLAKRAQRSILSFAPDVVVCTHATAAGVMDYLVREAHLPLRAVSVVTDFVVHRLWMYPATAGYFIADERLRHTWIRRFILPEKLHAMGIPIAASFGQSGARRAARAALAVSEQARMVLIMGGGAGLLPLVQIAAALNELTTPLYLFLVTGHNARAYQKLSGLKMNPQHRMMVLRFVTEVPRLMAAADVLISKPGGMTASEALCMQLPLLIYRPLPGQEQANADFLTANHAALQIENLEMLKKEIDKIFRIDTNAAENMKFCAKRIAHPNAAEAIAAHLLDTYCH